MYYCAKKFKISCAHRVVGHQGKCANLHGHNYTFIVKLCDEKINALGMVYDFYDIKTLLAPLLEKLDHKELNKELSFNPTAEQLAKYVFKYVQRQLQEQNETSRNTTPTVEKTNVKVYSVICEETEDGYAEYSESEL